MLIYFKFLIVFVSTVSVFNADATTFSPAEVSLPQNVVSSPFEVKRPRGPHKGIDISENIQRPTRFEVFSSGVWGVVKAPLGGEWGTITVEPFHSPGHYIQYLHTSRQNVNVGDVIAPWTIIGATGKTAPPETGLTGVHLHLQVIDRNGKPKYPQWKRAFINPQGFDTGNPVRGTFSRNDRYSEYIQLSSGKYLFHIDFTRKLTLSGDNPGAVGRVEYVKTFVLDIDRSMICTRKHSYSSTITQNTGNYFSSSFGNNNDCTNTGSFRCCSGTEGAPLQPMNMELKDISTIGVGANVRNLYYKRAGGLVETSLDSFVKSLRPSGGKASQELINLLKSTGITYKPKDFGEK